MTKITAAPVRHLCAGCGKKGRPGDPLLHARKGGYAHDRCDRP